MSNRRKSVHEREAQRNTNRWRPPVKGVVPSVLPRVDYRVMPPGEYLVNEEGAVLTVVDEEPRGTHDSGSAVDYPAPTPMHPEDAAEVEKTFFEQKAEVDALVAQANQTFGTKEVAEMYDVPEEMLGKPLAEIATHEFVPTQPTDAEAYIEAAVREYTSGMVTPQTKGKPTLADWAETNTAVRVALADETMGHKAVADLFDFTTESSVRRYRKAKGIEVQK
jgi:hypothetical protein